MWTEVTRQKYERKGRRCASDATDAEWLGPSGVAALGAECPQPHVFPRPDRPFTPSFRRRVLCQGAASRRRPVARLPTA